LGSFCKKQVVELSLSLSTTYSSNKRYSARVKPAWVRSANLSADLAAVGARHASLLPCEVHLLGFVLPKSTRRVRFAKSVQRAEVCSGSFCQTETLGSFGKNHWPRAIVPFCDVSSLTLQISGFIARQFTRSTLDRLRRISVRKHQLQGRIPKNSDRILSHKGGTRPMLEHQPNP